ncbi:hypothetical protein DM01DRAFT_1334688 [Hesseltinella vesiculosa]|uniref:Exosome complex protein n=1 Tax=Hesseltinella vesiculosa TaxID=101127 RepID=A0A1X2GLZ6_9FUNG|nr:hypothetical protein DM01DRAFT_1334688 [Hesseltinella vesiculosa]
MEAAQQQIPKRQARALRARIDIVLNHLQPLLDKDPEAFSALSKAERCKLDVLLAYTIDSLYYMFIRLHGQDPQKHQVFNELERVQEYIYKIKVMDGKASGAKPAEANSNPSPTTDNKPKRNPCV